VRFSHGIVSALTIFPKVFPFRNTVRFNFSPPTESKVNDERFGKTLAAFIALIFGMTSPIFRPAPPPQTGVNLKSDLKVLLMASRYQSRMPLFLGKESRRSPCRRPRFVENPRLSPPNPCLKGIELPDGGSGNHNAEGPCVEFIEVHRVLLGIGFVFSGSPAAEARRATTPLLMRPMIALTTL